MENQSGASIDPSWGSHTENLILPAILSDDSQELLSTRKTQPIISVQGFINGQFIGMENATNYPQLLHLEFHHPGVKTVYIQPSSKPQAYKQSGISYEPCQHKLFDVDPRIQNCSYQTGYSKVLDVISQEPVNSQT